MRLQAIEGTCRIGGMARKTQGRGKNAIHTSNAEELSCNFLAPQAAVAKADSSLPSVLVLLPGEQLFLSCRTRFPRLVLEKVAIYSGGDEGRKSNKRALWVCRAGAFRR